MKNNINKYEYDYLVAGGFIDNFNNFYIAYIDEIKNLIRTTYTSLKAFRNSHQIVNGHSITPQAYVTLLSVTKDCLENLAEWKITWAIARSQNTWWHNSFEESLRSYMAKYIVYNYHNQILY